MNIGASLKKGLDYLLMSFGVSSSAKKPSASVSPGGKADAPARPNTSGHPRRPDTNP